MVPKDDSNNEMIKLLHHHTFKTHKLDQYFEEIGYGKVQWTLFITVFLILAVEGLEFTLIGNILIPFKLYYGLSDFHIQFISSSLFLGVAAGSYGSGFLSNKIRRKHLTNVLFGLTCLLHLLYSLIMNIYVFGIARICLGFCMGIIVPLCLNNLCEFLPIKNRGLTMNAVWTGFTFGIVLLICIMKIAMPNLESSGLQNVYWYSLFFVILSYIVCLIFWEDSPRYLIMTNKTELAFDIIERMTKSKLHEVAKESIINDVKSGANIENKSAFCELFNKNYCYMTVLQIISWFGSNFIGYGVQLITSRTMKNIGMAEHKPNSEIITNLLVINSITLPAAIVGGLMCEIKVLGRLTTLISTTAISIAFCASMIAFPNHFDLMNGFFGFFQGLSGNVSTVYTSEIYPTSLRDLALGFFFSVTRIGCFTSQYIFLIFSNVDIWLPYYATIFVLVIILISYYLLPIETYGIPLDEEIENMKLDSERKHEKYQSLT